jgi:type II secretory pathway component GspD/PulD (secretin)
MSIAGCWWKLPLVRATSAAIALLAVCAALTADPPKAVDKKDTAPPTKPADKNDSSATTKRIKVFRLKNSAATDVQEKLDALLTVPGQGEAGAEGISVPPPVPGGGLIGTAPGMIGGAPSGVGGVGGIGGPPPGVGGVAGIGGFGGIGGVGGFGALGGIGGLPEPAPRYKIAVDDRTNAVVIRGTDHDLQVAAELVALMDLPKAKALPPLIHLRAFQLKHADATAIVTLLNELEVDARVVALVEPNLVVVSGSDAATKDIADAIKELDVEVKDAPPAKSKGM